MGEAVEQGGTARLNWPLLLLFWAAVAAFLVAKAVFSADRIPLIEDTDDAMRLVVVRDFLGGQGWYDNIQHRLNTPFGAEMHWSRLVDLPIAALILLFRPFAGAFAGTLAAYVWPLLLLFVLLWLSALLTVRLVGREGMLGALGIPVLSPAVLTEFSPGRIDHHSIQILLTLALVYCAIVSLRRPRWAIGAGVAAASAMAIGTEALPALATALLVYGLLWVVRPERGDAMRNFGGSLALAALVHLAIALPPSKWLTPMCDAISIVYVAAMVASGLAFVVLSLLPATGRTRLLRLLLGALAGIVVLAGIALAFPLCLAGPYGALDPWLVVNWLDRISEAKPIWTSLAGAPDLTVGYCLPPLIGLAILAWRLPRTPASERPAWLLLGAFLAVAVVVMAVQVRGARIATPLAVPAGAWLIAEARARYVAGGGLRAIAGLVGAWIAFAGIALLILVNVVDLGLSKLRPGQAEPDTLAAAAGSSRDCLQPAAFDDLAALPPERIMAPVDLGSHLLLFTPHAVVAAPYHRNQQGLRDTFDFFNLPISAVRPILERRGIGLVVVCSALTEMAGLPQATDDSFVRLLPHHALPDWLDEVSLPASPLRIFAVRAGS